MLAFSYCFINEICIEIDCHVDIGYHFFCSVVLFTWSLTHIFNLSISLLRHFEQVDVVLLSVDIIINYNVAYGAF